MAKYDNIDFTPTDAMAAEAKRGLAWRKEFKRGGTAVGVARAGQLARKQKLSPSTVKRMHSFFSRHEVDKKGEGFSKGPSFPSAGRIAWALWGGDAGQSWARKKVAQMDRADGKKAEAELSQVVEFGNYQREKRVSKAVEMTDELLAQIERITGTTVSASDIVVFEASVANTRPLNKMGSIFNQGRITEDTLRQMASALNAGEESVPLHTLHMQGGELPIGKVFQAEVLATSDGEAELRAMFYLPASESALVEKINLGIIDEVSIGLKSKQLLCSKCGFDYFSADAGFENLYSMTCDAGHTVGDDGTHVKLAGLDKWMELSLVSRGAASKPKILGRTKQIMSKETYDRIAADGLPPEAVVLFTASDELQARTGNPEYDNQGEMAKSQMRMVLEAAQEIHDMLADEDPLPGHVIEKLVLASTYIRDSRDYLKSEMAKEEEPMDPEIKAQFDAFGEKLNELSELVAALIPEQPTDEELAAAAAAAEAEALAAAEAQVSEQDAALKAELDAAKARIAELEAAAAPKNEEVTLDASGIPVGGVAASAIEDAKQLSAKPALNAFKTPKR
jgi:hypothetical protein